MGASPREPALIRAFPALCDRLPRCSFVPAATPVEPLPLAGWPEGTVFVKRDDRSCPLYGGNKPRKLEYVLGHARARGSRRLVTTGGLGTHHGLATTILGRSLGMRTTLVLVHQPVTPEVRETLHLHAAHGAELVYARGVAEAALQTAGVLARSAARGERPYRVPTGGSSPRGNLGLVSAGLELAEQVRVGELPEPERVFVAVGTGGTLAGLGLGLRLGGLRSQLVGVLVSDILPPSGARLARTARRAARLMRRAGAELPDLALRASDFHLERAWLGPGYGAPTPEAHEAVEAAARAGLRLETTYTGKCLAALLAAAPGPSASAGPVLLWNTHGRVGPQAAAHAAASGGLPRRLRRALA